MVLTNSLNFFSAINAQIFENAYIHNADVFVSNGVLTHKLKEYALPLPIGFTAYFYSNDVGAPINSFVGQLNSNYTLKVITNGKEYNANTFIPSNAFKLDSIWTKIAPQNTDTLKRVLFFKATDPIGYGNFGRYFTKKNSSIFLPGYNSVFDDQIIDGTTFTSLLPQGVDRNENIKSDSNFFKKGDTISVKFCNISKPAYTFWNSWEFAYQSNGNPFAQPNKVIGNISNGALGAFCGYAVQYKTLVSQ